MIRSFKGRWAASILVDRRIPKGFPHGIASLARRKLVQVNNAGALQDLASPPGTRLEALKGDRKGCYSIRINAQWRIVFRWRANGPEDVEIVDYH